jgi:hypothetical protein
MVATIAYALIAEWQLGAMKGQLKQMIGSSAQTDRMLCLYQQQLSKMDASIQQASRLATATETANQNILEADRPWLGATLLLDQDIAVGSSPTASISFINSGKRPARVILMGARPRLFVVFPKDPPYERGPLQRSSASFLGPGAQLGMKLRLVINGDGKITDEMVNRIKGPESLFIYAKVDYLDMRDNTVITLMRVGNTSPIPARAPPQMPFITVWYPTVITTQIEREQPRIPPLPFTA